MSLEAELKKAMGYTEDTSNRCPMCTHCEDGMNCYANKVLEFPIASEGRCKLFSAKRPRRSAKAATSDDDADTGEDTVDPVDTIPETDNSDRYVAFSEDELNGVDQ